MIQAGVDPDLQGEAHWWQTDDLWVWALEALIIYIRAAAEAPATPSRSSAIAWRPAMASS
jgi:hypothetical protein